MENTVKELEKIAKEIRIDIIEMLYRTGMDYKGHPGPALSIVDILSCLYFHEMNIDPLKPNYADRDRFILSKGHACPALYAVLAKKGFFNKSHLKTVRHINSILQGHPDMKKTPGIDFTAGSLGHGLGAGLGIALAGRLDKKNYKTYVILGDGEMQEGLIWEAVMTAGHYGVNNLVAIIDRNRFQSCDSVERTLDIEPLSDKLRSFKWEVIDIDGHDIGEILSSLTPGGESKPRAIIANTIKGKGVSFMENDNSWHQKSIDDDQYFKAIKELEEGQL